MSRETGRRRLLTPPNASLQPLLSEGFLTFPAGCRQQNWRPPASWAANAEGYGADSLPIKMQPWGSPRGPRLRCFLPRAGASFLLGRNLHGWPWACCHHPPGCLWPASSRKTSWAWPAVRMWHLGVHGVGMFARDRECSPGQENWNLTTEETWDVYTAPWTTRQSAALASSRSAGHPVPGGSLALGGEGPEGRGPGCQEG